MVAYLILLVNSSSNSVAFLQIKIFGYFCPNTEKNLHTHFSLIPATTKCRVFPVPIMANYATKRLICLWKNCDGMFENAAAFQEHVTNHGQQFNSNNHDHDTAEEEQPLAKKVKLDEDQDEIANQTEIDESKIVFLAIEVWVDVLGFIRRIQLAHTVSLTNRRFHQLCWPRLHGDKVNAHTVREFSIICREQFDRDLPPSALVLKNGKAMSLPSCPPPPYISGFGLIKINTLDEEVFEFFRLILPCIAAHRIKIVLNSYTLKVDQLLDIFREGASNIHLELNCEMDSIPSLSDLDNKMQKIKFENIHESDIPLLMKILATPRPDGQQRVICLPFQCGLMSILLEAIKKNHRNRIIKAFQILSQPAATVRE